ncbi:MAG: PHP domain-containing protein, partial [Gemmatimonadetes bacterium]|nr:PHP domain-containing protein [Gemmatimonadota bacterium]
MSYADLHLHTRHSDGEWTPRKVVREAAIARVSCIAITDHDQTGGLPEAIEAGADFGIRVLSGVELSTFDGTDRHVLGYGFDPSAESLRILNEGAQADRFVRAERICERLAALGVPVELDAVLAEAGDAAPGRPHVARALVKARHVRTIREAFDVWLGDGKPACVEKRRVEPGEAIRVLHEAGGVAVAAHPGIVGGPETLDPLVEAGLDGVEVKHPLHGDRSEAA